MTEPEVASSDATNIATRITATAIDYVINGRKWWSSGAMSPRCKLLIVMGVTDPDAEPSPPAEHDLRARRRRPGVTVQRSTGVFGYDDGPHGGHGDISIRQRARPGRRTCSARKATASASRRSGSGPGPDPPRMRAIGMAERALEMMCQRTASRTAFGRPIIEQGVVQQWIARARHRDRAGAPAGAEDGLADGHGRQLRVPGSRSPRSRSPPRRWPPG